MAFDIETTRLISIHAPRTGSDIMPNQAYAKYMEISIHAPRTGSDAGIPLTLEIAICISIHAPRTGSDAHRRQLRHARRNFNPRSPHGERHRCSEASKPSAKISIHAPRTGSDTAAEEKEVQKEKISIHAPRTGSDGRLAAVRCPCRHFNPRSPHGERPDQRGFLSGRWSISIHAPRTGSDRATKSLLCVSRHFNPRSPHGERPARLPFPRRRGRVISIHAPRTGSDFQHGRNSGQRNTFQSTLPARGATLFQLCILPDQKFQSTLPARGATVFRRALIKTNTISIHAPRTGSDSESTG